MGKFKGGIIQFPPNGLHYFFNDQYGFQGLFLGRVQQRHKALRELHRLEQKCEELFLFAIRTFEGIDLGD